MVQLPTLLFDFYPLSLSPSDPPDRSSLSGTYCTTIFQTESTRMISRFLLVLLLPVTLTGCLKSIGMGPSIELTIRGTSFSPRSGERLEFHIGGRSDGPPSDKLIVLIQGSGEGSIRERFGYGAEAVTLGYDVVYLEKYAWDNPAIFRRTDSRTRRLHDIRSALRFIIDSVYGGSVKTIGIISDSEGGVIAPDIAEAIPETKWLVVLGAGGMTQREELETLFRRNAAPYAAIGITTLDQLRAQFDRIHSNPVGDSVWYGHSWLYWNSYLDYSPTTTISRLTIPALFIMGGRDQTVPIESLRQLQKSVAGHQNVSFHVVDEADHTFLDPDGDSLFESTIRDVVQPWYRNTVEPVLSR